MRKFLSFVLYLSVAVFAAGDLWAYDPMADARSFKKNQTRHFTGKDRALGRDMTQLAARTERRMRRSRRSFWRYPTKTPRRLMRRKDKIRRYGLRQMRPMRVRPVKSYWAKPQKRARAKPKTFTKTRAKPKRRPVIQAKLAPAPTPARGRGTRQTLPMDSAGLSAPVLKFARRFQVKPSLILSVIKNESDFDPNAASAKGAHGLMQLVPESGGREAMSFLSGRQTTPSVSYLRRPKANIELGTTYLHILQNLYFGAIRDPQSRRYAVIAAYNAGPSRVAKAVTGGRDLKDAIQKINRMTPAQFYGRLMDHLPHAETRVYLARVTRDLGLYSSLDRRS